MAELSKSGEGMIVVGRECSIGAGAHAHFAHPGKIVLGDYVTIGENVKFVVDQGAVEIGDWTTIHANSIILCKAGVSIGEHCWFGQHTVIDGTGGLTIKRGVRVGMFSQLWTHVAAGEQIEGCTLFGEAPSVIEEESWFVGTCFLASGVVVGRRTIALAGSNITKSCPPNSVLAGAPARVKEDLNFYREIRLEEKFDLLAGWLRALASESGSTLNFTSDVASIAAVDGTVRFHKSAHSFEKALESGGGDPITHCCLETKRYRKVFTGAERRVLKYLSGNKARFYAT